MTITPKTKGYDLFVGIDWSGAKGQYHKGIQVASLGADHSPPKLIAAPNGKAWSRHGVMDYLKGEAENKRVLAGFDFAFAHPFMDKEGYYPGLGTPPSDAAALWQMVDAINQDHSHLYGGGIWGHNDLGLYYNHQKSPPNNADKSRNDLFVSRRRQTENAARDHHKVTPSPTFNCIGAAGVGTGSLAGMRLLHHLAPSAHIWPFHETDERGQGDGQSAKKTLTLVEIYPALYFNMAGVSDKAKKSEPLAAINQGLSHFDTSPITDITSGLPDLDDLDAIISAAALRALHDPLEVFAINTPELKAAAAKEGWIFGVKSDKKAS